jgi:polysaccharide export outer membrane protein
VELPPGYVIGLQDVLDVLVWKDEDMSAKDVVVRPDGMISVPLINDVRGDGLTVEQLRLRLTEAAAKFIDDPTVAVVVKAINSRRVSVLGQVAKPSQYNLLSRMTVVDLLSMAGGVHEFAKTKNIRITRGKESLQLNFKEFLEGKARAIAQNIELQPGDIVSVP